MRLSFSALVSTVLICSCALDPSADGADAESAYPEDDPASYEEVYGAGAALLQPGNWRPDVVGGHQRYDDGPAWQGGRNCTGTFTAGARELRTYLQATYPQISSIGGYNCRQNTASPSKTSLHGTGRALDVMIPMDRRQADNDAGDPIARWLIQHATELGVQYIIWDRTSYNSSRTGTKYRTYTGPNPHVDHLHVELNFDGANRRTSFYGGTPAPVAMPRPMAATPSGGAPLLRSPFATSESTGSLVSHTQRGSTVDYQCAANGRRNHKGTDFRVPIGTPVHAAAPGTVIRMNDNCDNRGSLSSGCGGGFGNHVLIQHAGGRATLYAHFSPRSGLPRVGQSVGCGDRLGLSGNSGRSSGPHMHFEVRDGVTGEGSYFSRPPTDPFGGACSSQATSLWAGGAGPAQTCSAAGAGAMPRGDDSAFVGATISTRQQVNPGGHVRQTWRLRNTGSTTWAHPQYGLARTSGPAFEGPASIGLAEATTVAPGGTSAFIFDATAPMEPGVYTARFRMSQGTAFGATVYLELEVTMPAPGCQSFTLGREVPSNSCVQVSYAGCGQPSCAWYQCTDGAWTCASRAGCDDDMAFDNAACGAPTTCLPEAHLCSQDAECCGSTPGGAVRCLAGYCRDTAMCPAPVMTCGSRTDCCVGTACSPATIGGGKECCLRDNDLCRSDEECCGEMTCGVDGRCVGRVPGQSCASTQDCAGSSLCEGSVCR